MSLYPFGSFVLISQKPFLLPFLRSMMPFPVKFVVMVFDGSFGFAYMRSDFFLRGFWLFS